MDPLSGSCRLPVVSDGGETRESVSDSGDCSWRLREVTLIEPDLLFCLEVEYSPDNQASVADCASAEVPGPPVNDKQSSELPKVDKISAILSTFGTKHPFFSLTQISIYAGQLYDYYLAPHVSITGPDSKCNYLFSILLACHYAGIETPAVIGWELAKIGSEFLNNYLRTIELYVEISGQDPANIHYDQIQEIHDLVLETGFFPAAWLLVDLALGADQYHLISPHAIPRLLSAFFGRGREILASMNVFSFQAKTAFIAVARAGELETFFQSKDMSEHELFMLLLAGILMDEPLVELEQYWKELDAGFPVKAKCILNYDWFDILMSRKAGNTSSVRRNRSQYCIEEILAACEQMGYDAKSFKRTIKSHHLALLKHHDSGARKRDYYLSLLQTSTVVQSPYLSGIIELTRGITHRFSSGVAKRPLTSAIYLMNATEKGRFPLLSKDAGDIYLGFGRFHKAREQYQKLTSLSSLPDSLKNRLDALIEICELHIPNQTESPPDSPPQKQSGAFRNNKKSKKKNQQKKNVLMKSTLSSAKEALVTATRTQETTNLTSADAVKQTADSGQESYPQISAEVMDQNRQRHFSWGLEGVQIQKQEFSMVSACARAKRVCESSAAASDKSSATPGPMLFMPKAGCFSDFDGEVKCFIQEVSICRDQGLLAKEKDCIERWLKKERTYGRVCEDAAWFYIRQCILPIQFNTVLLLEDRLAAKLKSDSVTKGQMLNLALNWIARAMACYLGCAIEQRIPSSRLKEKLVNMHQNFPEKKRNAEACKRLRSGCSGYGHVFSELGGFTQSKKMRGLYYEKGREFFDLKRIADPFYYIQEPSSYSAKNLPQEQ